MAKKKKNNNQQTSGIASNKDMEATQPAPPVIIDNDDEIEKLSSPASPIAQLCDEELKLFCKGGRYLNFALSFACGGGFFILL
jgi:hypothetical protein